MVNRIDRIEQWLYELGLYAMSEQEARYLADPAIRDTLCEVFTDLVFVCERRYKDNSFWPDFSLLELDCEIPKKPRVHRPRTFAIGV